MHEAKSSFGLWIWLVRALVLAAFAALILWRWADVGIALDPIRRSAAYVVPTGFLGGLVASATGAGGGFVYVPVFDILRDVTFVRMNFHQIVATAYVVQVFGLAMGAAGWLSHLYGARGVADRHGLPGNDLLAIVFTTLCASIPSILVTQAFVPLADRTLQTAFMIFALALGVALLVFTWAFRRVEAARTRPERFDLYMFLVLGVAGGYVTAFFSVGIGEFLVIYLVFRKFPVYAAVAASVLVTCLTVGAGTLVNLAQGRVVWEVALPAIPGAILGGFLAHWVAAAIGPLWVKTVAALWIIGSSLYLILRALF